MALLPDWDGIDWNDRDVGLTCVVLIREGLLREGLAINDIVSGIPEQAALIVQSAESLIPNLFPLRFLRSFAAHASMLTGDEEFTRKAIRDFVFLGDKLEVVTALSGSFFSIKQLLKQFGSRLNRSLNALFEIQLREIGPKTMEVELCNFKENYLSEPGAWYGNQINGGTLEGIPLMVGGGYASVQMTGFCPLDDRGEALCNRYVMEVNEVRLLKRLKNIYTFLSYLKLRRSINGLFKKLNRNISSKQLATMILNLEEERNRFSHDFGNAIVEAQLLERLIYKDMEAFFNSMPAESENIEELYEKMTALRSSLINLRTITEDFREPVSWAPSFARQKHEDSLINLFEFIQDLSKPYLSSGIFIANEIDPQTFIKTKEKSMRIIVSNMLSNAVKAVRESKRKDKRIMIQSQYFQDSCSIFIEDNGCGILPHLHPSIWEKSFSAFHQGKGLGLFVIRQLIEEIGGKVSLEYSEMRFGTIFRIDLPYSQP